MASQAQHHLADVFPRSVGAPTEMRVCHVMSADLWAGAEVQVATVASYLVGQPDMHLSAVLLNEGPLACELRRLGVQVKVIDEHQNSAIRILSFLTRFLRDHDIEIVHTHRNKDSVLGILAAKLAGVPHVIRTVHGLTEPMTGWDRAKFRAYEALDKGTLLCFADRIIAVSKRMAETLRGSGYGATMVTHIHNGVDLRKVGVTRSPEEVRGELGLDSQTLLIGTAGRLSPVKGHAGLLRAARLIFEKERRARLLIVGGGPLAEELRASAARLQIDDRCLFVGPRADVYDLISAMDVFVLPSLDEGIPMAILEAMALGRPVVATAVGGVPEIIRHRATGLLVKAKDEQALADACLELALNRDWAQTLGARARRVVEEEFSHERNGHNLMEVYRSVFVGRKAAGVGWFDRFRMRSVAASGGRIGAQPPTSAGGRAPAGRLNQVTLGQLTLLWRLAGKVAAYGRRTLDRAVERRRMNRIRCNPAVLTAALKSARSILIVCHGNIIRSAFAARLVTQVLGDDRRISISSGGLEAVPGTPPHPTAVFSANGLCVDLRDHTAGPVTPDSVANADVIFVMEIPHLLVMRKRFPEARAKTFLLTCLAPGTPLEIRDPVEGDESLFQTCFEHIVRAVRPIVRILSHTAEPFGPGELQSVLAMERPSQ